MVEFAVNTIVIYTIAWQWRQGETFLWWLNHVVKTGGVGC